jgi:oxaloacetate decarboxylase gamma subunit
MAEINLIDEAVKFMVLGMGIVFIFLYLMVLVVRVQSYIINKYFPEVSVVAPEPKKSDNRAKTTAAIIAAIEHHNNTKVNNG